MTKKEIVQQIAARIEETQLKTKEIVQLTFDAIVETLITSKDRRIELRNFGVFEVKLRKGRKARNPRSNAPVTVPAKYVVTFKPGKEMEERVRQLVPTAEAWRPSRRRPPRPPRLPPPTVPPPRTASPPRARSGVRASPPRPVRPPNNPFKITSRYNRSLPQAPVIAGRCPSSRSRRGIPAEPAGIRPRRAVPNP